MHLKKNNLILNMTHKMKNAEKTLKKKLFFKDEIGRNFTAEETEKIWADARLRLQKMYDEHSDLPKGVRLHTDGFIFPAAAIYLAMKEFDSHKAFSVMQKVMKEKALESGRKFASFVRLPFGKRLFLKMWDTISHKMFSDSAGFKNVFYPKQKGVFRMDITQCPYNTYLTALGCQELTRLFCENDVYSYGNLPGLDFIRTQTIGSGGRLCDFKLAMKTK